MTDRQLFIDLFKHLAAFGSSESGATAIEYALIGSLVAVAFIGGATLLGGNIGDMFNSIATRIITAMREGPMGNGSI